VQKLLEISLSNMRASNHAMVSKIGCPPASPEPRDPPATARHERAGGGQAPGALHHVMGRGSERKRIFLNNKDRSDFLGRLAELADDDSMDIYAWALLHIT